ncbi:hypothetical protein BDV33DRAFT_198408 [Aspergillus novoparasiticus]|uniref:BD-FAE-like domain-containing protein n=1 Tax=Aspergillus novoparasiticus TaxID=986946 RepID=A0A5N6F9S4_9EURO|nr:hypothetical protein BDV33DRAFT_198408 [Aspergillus novoparasiticus]
MATNPDVDQSTISEPNPIAITARGKEITGLDIVQTTSESITAARVEELVSGMNIDKPIGGTDMAYGNKDTQHLRFWKGTSSKAPIIVFFHVVTVKHHVQEVADSLGYLVKNVDSLGFDPERVILMGHSSGTHVVTLLGTDPSYVERAGISLDIVHALISLDGSNYNALAEITDSPGPVADNLIYGLGTDPDRLYAMSPTYHAQAPNADASLLLHVHRQGDIRQAVELVAGPPPTRSGFGL